MKCLIKTRGGELIPIMTGDLLEFTPDNSWVSRGISWWTGSKYSHVEVAVADVWGAKVGGGAVDIGFRLTSIAKQIAKGKRGIDVYRIRQYSDDFQYVTDNNGVQWSLSEKALTMAAISLLEFPYDWSLIRRISWMTLFKRPRATGLTRSRIICTQAYGLTLKIASLYSHFGREPELLSDDEVKEWANVDGGFDILPGVHDSLMTPQDVAGSPYLGLKGKLVLVDDF